MRNASLAAIALVISAAACSTSETHLRPAPSADIAPVGRGRGAVATDAGVRVEVRSGAWSGDPVQLATEMTPLYVTITNNAGRPLLVRYPSMRLRQGGVAYAAIAPYDIEEDVEEEYFLADYPYRTYRMTPHRARYYPRGADPFWWDDPYYDYWGAWPTYVSIELPTRDMVEAALQEGALAPGEQVSGFLYFEELDDDVADVRFTVELIDATTRQRFGRVEIPFVAY